MTPSSGADPPPLPQIRRPRRDDAVEAARLQYLACTKVDMATIAESLGIGRTTIYRWFPGRERLITEVLLKLREDGWDAVRAETTDDPVAEALATMTNAMTAAAAFEPLRFFTHNEPEAALRILLDPDGTLVADTRESVAEIIAPCYPDGRADPQVVRAIVAIGLAIVYAALAADHEPEIESATLAIRALLTSPDVQKSRRPSRPATKTGMARQRSRKQPR